MGVTVETLKAVRFAAMLAACAPCLAQDALLVQVT